MNRRSAAICLILALLLPGLITTADNAAPPGFAPLEIYLDTGPAHLAAYQVELTLPAGAQIVGVEGGEPAVFRDAPYYDPAALMNHRIIIAAFSTADAGMLPTGNVRIARLHLELQSGTLPEALPKITRKLMVASDARGDNIPATLSLRVGEKHEMHEKQRKQGEKP